MAAPLKKLPSIAEQTVAAPSIELAAATAEPQPSPARELQALLARQTIEPVAAPVLAAPIRREQAIFIAAAAGVLWGTIAAAYLAFTLAGG